VIHTPTYMLTKSSVPYTLDDGSAMFGTKTALIYVHQLA